MTMESLSEQARSLSSGTMATLTGERQYVVLDKIQEEFVAFCEEREETNWLLAWHAYENRRVNRL